LFLPVVRHQQHFDVPGKRGELLFAWATGRLSRYLVIVSALKVLGSMPQKPEPIALNSGSLGRVLD
jgi:hypothetical protein